MNIKLTKKRTLILNALKTHHGTLSAADISQKIPEIDLVTIYRNLDLFVKKNLLKRFTLTQMKRSTNINTNRTIMQSAPTARK